MRDKADDVVGSAVNKPTDVLLTNVACGFHDCPSGGRKTHTTGRGISELLASGTEVCKGQREMAGKLIANLSIFRFQTN